MERKMKDAYSKNTFSCVMVGLFFMLILILPSCSSAEQISFEPNTSMELKLFCFDTDTDLCGSGISCEVTVFYPNSTTYIDNQSMSQTGSYWNYTANASSTLGIYKAVANCHDATTSGYSSWDFYIGRPSTEVQEATTTRSIYILLGIAVLCFTAFLFISHPPIKWSFFLLAILFISITVNVASISLYNEAGNENIRNIFDKLGAMTYYMYYFVAGLIAFIWIFSIFNTLASKKTMKQAANVGDVRGYNFLNK